MGACTELRWWKNWENVSVGEKVTVRFQSCMRFFFWKNELGGQEKVGWIVSLTVGTGW